MQIAIERCLISNDLILFFPLCRVVVEPARGQARGSHRDRYNDNDRYSSRRGGGRYNNDK